MIKLLFITSSLLGFCPAKTFAKTYQLKELIDLAKVHPEIQIEQFEVEKAKTLFEKIDGETGPRLSLLGGIGPNKSATGNAIASVESDKIDTATFLGKIDLKLPLYTFGRKDLLRKAADGNVKVKELDVKKKEALLAKKVKEYFYGFQYASSLNDFANSTLKDLDGALEDMKKAKKRSEDDLSKLTLFRSLVQVKKFEIEKGLAQSLLGLKFISQDPEPKVEQDWLDFNPRNLPDLESINKKMAMTNFDLQKANIGVDARNAYLTSEKRAELPVVGLFSSYDWRSTRKSTRQTSEFSYDPYNRSDFSIGVGFIWEIDFGIKSSNVSAAKIELDTVKAQQAYAEKNLPIQMEKIYLELMESQKRATELQASYKTSKKLVGNIASGVALGLTSAKDIIEAYTMKAQIYQQMMEAVYNYELKLAELSFESGQELDSNL